MNCLIIYNPTSGKGKIQKNLQKIIKMLKKKYDEVEVHPIIPPEKASQVAEENINKYDTYIVAGGDGTLNEVINGIAEKDNAPTIGYIPCGTTNDVARSLSIPRNIKRAIKVILKGKIFNHDIFKVNDRYAIYVCTTGLGCEASYETKQKAKRFFGRLAYFVYGAKKIFKTEPLNLKISYFDEKLVTNTLRCSLLLILNSKSVAGFKVNKKAVLDDGYIDVVMIFNKSKKLNFFSIFTLCKLFLFGLDYTKKSKFLVYYKLKEFNIDIENARDINLDGELGLNESFKVKMIEKGVKIYIP